MVGLTRAVVAATCLLVIAGGLVTSTDSGLAVPDWPLSYGRLLPPMVGGVLYEHSHRMIAATVGGLTLILTVWIGIREPRRWVRRLAIAALGAVVAQGILGGLTVLWRLPTLISVAHACLGSTVFVLVVLLAVTYREPPTPPSPAAGMTPRGPLAWAAALTLVTLFLQLLLGATLRHAGWHSRLVAVHLLGALAAAVCVLWTAWIAGWREAGEATIARRALWLVGLTGVQIWLGLVTLAGHRPVWAATAHVAVGALLLANAAVLTWHAGRGQLSVAIARERLLVYLELTKPRLTLLAAVTMLAGFYLGAQGPLPVGRLVATLAGAFLIGGGAAALNQYLERAADARMSRTCRRPLPSGRVTPCAALTFGLTLAALGLAALGGLVNGLTAALGLTTLISYLWVYTPLKTRTALCTLAGAVPGATPPLIGWAAARGTLEPGAWVLFALVFLWQLPHFLALAWWHRAEYARAGFRMLPVIDPGGGVVGRQITLSCLALVPVSLAPTILAVTGGAYFVGALILGLAFLGVGVRAAVAQTPRAARRLFLASIAYLPGLLTAMALDKVAL